MITLIASILVFSAIIMVHEIGHYKAAKSVGIKVNEFAIGMGPTIYKKEKRGTVYSVRAIPIGGFVLMEGEEEDVKSSTSFSQKSVWKRFKVVAAGPVMNFLLALVLFLIVAFSFGVYGNTVDQIDENSNEYAAGIRPGDKIVSVNGQRSYIWEDIYFEMINEDNKYYTAEVEHDGAVKEYKIDNNYKKIVGITSNVVNGETTTTVSPTDMNSPAYKAGIKDGDVVKKINDVEVSTWDQVTEQIALSKANEPIKVTVNRNGQILDFNMVPEEQISVRYNTMLEKSFVTAIASSAYKTVYYIELMFKSIVMIFTGKASSDSIGGPIMVISMVGEAAESGILSLLSLAAFISINLGFMNLLPIPALDGSKLVFLIVEAIRGKSIPVEKEGYVHFIGFVVLIGIMLLITFNDIMRLFRL